MNKDDRTDRLEDDSMSDPQNWDSEDYPPIEGFELYPEDKKSTILQKFRELFGYREK